MKWSLFPRFGLPDCLHWSGGSGSSFLCSTHVPMVGAYSYPAFLHPSVAHHYTAISLGFKMPTKASKLRSSLTLDILLYYLCWFPICDLSWAHQLPSGSPIFVSESPVFVSEMILQISPWPRWAQQSWELPPPLLFVSPAAAGGGVGLEWLGQGRDISCCSSVSLLTINCMSAGHVFQRVVCKADSPGEMLSTANGAWNICFSLPSVAGSTPWCKEFIISWYEAQTQNTVFKQILKTEESKRLHFEEKPAWTETCIFNQSSIIHVILMWSIW